ncbi:unnamed protein product [Onchocerca ochengi]|uniref:Uncharacterized protein n=1 Tax=Onchocerca ochengi TaxID=42157 RepID=A0A182E6F2_ONCOC|nr:unnamed protein product [Onchocerca ochengi]
MKGSNKTSKHIKNPLLRLIRLLLTRRNLPHSRDREYLCNNLRSRCGLHYRYKRLRLRSSITGRSAVSMYATSSTGSSSLCDDEKYLTPILLVVISVNERRHFVETRDDLLNDLENDDV